MIDSNINSNIINANSYLLSTVGFNRGLGLGFGLGIGICLYLNRNTLLNKKYLYLDKTLDFMLETKRAISQYFYPLPKTEKEIVIKQIRFRKLNKNNREISQSCYLLDYHLEKLGEINLTNLPLPNQEKYDCHHYSRLQNVNVNVNENVNENNNNNEEVDLQLVDIDYTFNGQHYRYTTKNDSASNVIQFYKVDKLKTQLHVFFENVVITKNDGTEYNLTYSERDKIVKRFNQYLGPLGDFHSSLNPINITWVTLYDLDLQKGDKIVLTTQLMDDVELIWDNNVELNCHI